MEIVTLLWVGRDIEQMLVSLNIISFGVMSLIQWPKDLLTKKKGYAYLEIPVVLSSHGPEYLLYFSVCN